MGLRLLRRGKEDDHRLEIIASDGSSTAPLTASGDARIDGGAEFPSGLVARGDLTLGSTARVRGAVRVAGRLTLEAGAQLVGDAVVDGVTLAWPGACIEGSLTCRRLLLVSDDIDPVELEPTARDSSRSTGTA